MTRQKAITRAISVITAITFFWTNCVWAGGVQGMQYEIRADKLAVQSQIRDTILGAQLMYTGDVALETLIERSVATNKDIYRNVDKLREDYIGKVGGIQLKDKDKIGWLVFSDSRYTDDEVPYPHKRQYENHKAYYVFTGNGIFFRYTPVTDKGDRLEVEDSFNRVLRGHGRLEGEGDTMELEVNGVVRRFYREKYRIVEQNLDFINLCLEELLGVEVVAVGKEVERKVRGEVMVMPVGDREEYERYQRRNDPANTHYGLTSIMGLPMADTVAQKAGEIQGVINAFLASVEGVEFSGYSLDHLHCTMSSMTRTRDDRPYTQTDIAGLNFERVKDIIRHASAFNISFSGVLINDKGEVLITGKGDESLKGLRQRLITEAGFLGRAYDQNEEVHVMIGYIKGYVNLTGEQREALGRALSAKLGELGYNLGSQRVDSIKLVHYGHRSMRRILASADLRFGENIPAERDLARELVGEREPPRGGGETGRTGIKLLDGASLIMAGGFILGNFDKIVMWFLGLGLGWQLLIGLCTVGVLVVAGLLIWKKVSPVTYYIWRLRNVQKKNMHFAYSTGLILEALIKIDDVDTYRKEWGDNYRDILNTYLLLNGRRFGEVVKVGKSAVPILIEVLHCDYNDWIKASAAGVLLEINDVEAYRREWGDDYGDILTAYKLVGAIVIKSEEKWEEIAKIGKSAVPILIDVMRNGEEHDKIGAAGALARIGVEIGFSKLIDVLNSAEEYLVSRAEKTLKRLGYMFYDKKVEGGRKVKVSQFKTETVQPSEEGSYWGAEPQDVRVKTGTKTMWIKKADKGDIERELSKIATADSIIDWQRGFERIGQDVVTVGFARGAMGRMVVEIPIPRYGELTEEQKRIVERYVAVEIHNFNHLIGVTGIYINCDEELFNRVREYFNPDRSANQPYGWQIRVLKTVYALADYPIIRRAELSEIMALPVDTTPAEQRMPDVKKGRRIGIDIGGSDLKVVAVVDGEEPVFYKEFVWSPAKMANPETEHVPCILALVDLARIKLGIYDLEQAGTITPEVADLKARIEAVESHFDGHDEARNRISRGELERLVSEARALAQKAGIVLEASVDAIGVSANLACVDNKIRGTGKLTDGVTTAPVSEDDRQRKIEAVRSNRKMSAEQQRTEIGYLQRVEIVPEDEKSRRLGILMNLDSLLYTRYSVPVAVFNDGDALALWAAVENNDRSVLAFALGSGIATGYCDELGLVADIMGESGAVTINMSVDAPVTVGPSDRGGINKFITQRAVIEPGRLAHQYGIQLPEGVDEDTQLLTVQRLFDSGDPADVAKAETIFKTIGRDLATSIYVVNRNLRAYVREKSRYSDKERPIRSVLISGRVTRGRSGKVLLDEANRVLSKKYGLGHITVRASDTGDERRDEINKRFSQAVGATFLASQKWQRQLTSSIRTSGRALQVLKEGSLEDVIAHLRSIGKAREADNLRLAYDNALRNVRERTHRVTTTPQVRLVKDAPYTAAFDNVLDINIDMLVSEVFSRLEIEEELYHVALNSRGAAPNVTEEALQELLTDEVKVERFHRLTVEEQAEYLGLVLSRPSDIDTYGFFKIYIRTYRDTGKFDRLISVLRDRYGIEARAIDGLRLLRTEQGSISRLVYEYDSQAGIHSDGVRSEMLRLRRVAEGHDNYRYMLGLYNNNRDELERAIYEEADRTGRTYEQVVLGCIGRDKVPQPYELEIERGYPKADSPEEAYSTEYLFLGGGGFNTSGHARSAMDYYEKLSEEEKRLVDSMLYVACSVAAFDDGGHSVEIQNIIYDIFGVYLPAIGDPMAPILFLILDKWFKDYGGIYSEQPGLAPTLRQGKTDLLLINRNRFNLAEIGSVEQKMKDRLAEIQRNRGMDKSRDWLFFVANMIGVGRVIDERYLARMKTQKSAAVQNIAGLGALTDAGVLGQGRLNEPSFGPVEGMLGLRRGHVSLSSYDEATLVAVLRDGREVPTQTDITDKEHPALIDHLYFKKVRRDANGVVERDGDSKPVYIDLALQDRPKVTEETRKLIRNTRKAIVVGAGSMFTSILPVLMLRGIVEELKAAKARGVPVIMVFKPVWDIETSIFTQDGFMGMSISEMATAFEKTLQAVNEDNSIRFSDIFSHVFIPNIPGESLKMYEDVRLLKKTASGFKAKGEVTLFNDTGKAEIANIPDDMDYTEAVNRIKNLLDNDSNLTQEGIDAKRSKTLKLSKFLPIPAVKVTDNDREYFEGEGLEVVEIDRPEDYMMWTGKLHYNPDSLFKRTQGAATTPMFLKGIVTTQTKVINIIGQSECYKEEAIDAMVREFNGIRFNIDNVYRAYAYKALRTGLIDNQGNILDKDGLLHMAEDTEVRFDEVQGRIYLDSQDVTDELSAHKGLELGIIEYMPVKMIIERNTEKILRKFGFMARPVFISSRRYYPYASLNIYLSAGVPKRAQRRIEVQGLTTATVEVGDRITREDTEGNEGRVIQQYPDLFEIIDTSYMARQEVVDDLIIKLRIQINNEKRRVLLQRRAYTDIKNDRQQDRRGKISVIALKGGEMGALHPEVKARVLDKLRQAGFRVTLCPVVDISSKEMLERWFAGDAGPKMLLDRFASEGANSELVEEGKLIMDSLDFYKFQEWVDRARAQYPNSNALATLELLVKYLKGSFQLIFLTRNKSRKEVIDSLGINESDAKAIIKKVLVKKYKKEGLDNTAAGAKAEAECSKGLDDINIDEQDFIKNIVIGPTNPQDVFPGSLRDLVFQELTGGALVGVKAEAGRVLGTGLEGVDPEERQRLIDLRTKFIATAIHSPSSDELSREISQMGAMRAKVTLVNISSPSQASERQWAFPVQILAGHLRMKTEAEVTLVDMEKYLIQSERQQKEEARMDVASRFDYAIEKTIEEVVRTKPLVVGLTMKWDTLEVCERIIQGVRQRMGAASPLFLIGNVMATFGAEDILRRESFKDVILVVGEGEESIEKIALKIRDHADTYRTDRTIYADIANLCFLHPESGAVVRTPRRVLDSENYRFPDETEAIEYFAREGREESVDIPIEASRGCYWNRCVFCSMRVLCSPENVGWRPFPIEDVLKRIRTFARNGQRAFHFIDSEFAGPVGNERDFNNTMDRLERLADGIMEINRELGLEGSDKIRITIISVRADTFYQTKKGDWNKRSMLVLRKLKEAGLEKIFIGVESGSQEQVRRYAKGINIEESIISIRRIREVGIELEVGFVFFDPFASLEELRDNIKFIDNHRLYDTNSRLFKPLRAQAGSPGVEVLRRKGLLLTPDLDLTNLSFPYRYQDETGQIRYLEELHNEWERQIHPLSRYLITLHRNVEPVTEDNIRLRDRLSALMNRLRYIDFKFMEGIVRAETEEDRIRGRISALELLSEYFREIMEASVRGEYPEPAPRLIDEFIRPALSMNARLLERARLDLSNTVAGTIGDVIQDLNARNIPQQYRDNLRNGYESALVIAKARYSPMQVELISSRLIQVKVNSVDTPDINPEAILINYDTLVSVSRVTEEFLKRFDSLLIAGQSLEDRGLYELYTALQEVYYFLSLPLKSQAAYLYSLIREGNLNRNDLGFYTVLVRSYGDRQRFEELLKLLSQGYGITNQNRAILMRFFNERRGDALDLTLEYLKNDTNRNGDVRDYLRNQERGQLKEAMERRYGRGYLSIHPIVSIEEFVGLLGVEVAEVLGLDLTTETGRQQLREAILGFYGKEHYRRPEVQITNQRLLRYIVSSGATCSINNSVAYITVQERLTAIREKLDNVLQAVIIEDGTGEVYKCIADSYKEIVMPVLNITVRKEEQEVRPEVRLPDLDNVVAGSLANIKKGLHERGYRYTEETEGFLRRYLPLILQEGLDRRELASHRDIIEVLGQKAAEDPYLVALILKEYFHARVQIRSSRDEERRRIYTLDNGAPIWSDWALMSRIASLSSEKTSFHALPVDKLKELLALNPTKRYRVLVIGSGSGRLARDLIDYPGARGRVEIVETDLEPETVLRNFRQNTIAGLNSSIKGVPANVADLFSWEDGSFDVVISFGAMRYFADRVGRQAASEIRRVLREDGIALVGDSVPADMQEGVFDRFAGHFQAEGLNTRIIGADIVGFRTTTCYNMLYQYNHPTMSDYNRLLKTAVDRMVVAERERTGAEVDHLSVLFDSVVGYRIASSKMVMAGRDSGLLDSLSSTELKDEKACRLVVKDTLARLTLNKDEVFKIRINAEASNLVQLGVFMGLNPLVEILKLISYVADYDAQRSMGFAETITDIFTLVRQAHPGGAERICRELAYRIPGLIERLRTPENIWNVFIAAQGLANEGGRRTLDIWVNEALNFINNAPSLIEKIGLEYTLKLVKCRRQISYIMDPDAARLLAIYEGIKADIDGGRDLETIQERLDTLESEILRLLRQMPVEIAEVDEIGYKDVDVNFVVRGILKVNKSIKTTIWGGRIETELIKEKKRKGAKVYVAYINVGRQRKIIGQAVLIGNFFRLHAVMDIFQHGLGVGTALFSRCVRQCLQEGYPSVYLYVTRGNQPVLEYHRGILERYSPTFMQIGDDLGLRLSPTTEQREVILKDSIPAVKFEYHFFSEDQRRGIVRECVDEYYEPADRILYKIGKRGLEEIASLISGVGLNDRDKVNAVRILDDIVSEFEQRRARVYFRYIYDDFYRVVGAFGSRGRPDRFMEAIRTTYRFLRDNRDKTDEQFVIGFRGFLTGLKQVHEFPDLPRGVESTAISVIGGTMSGKTALSIALASHKDIHAFVLPVGYLYRFFASLSMEMRIDVDNPNEIIKMARESIMDVEICYRGNEAQIKYRGQDITARIKRRVDIEQRSDLLIKRTTEAFRGQVNPYHVIISTFWTSYLKAIIGNGVNALVDISPSAFRRIDCKKLGIFITGDIRRRAEDTFSFSYCREDRDLESAYTRILPEATRDDFGRDLAELGAAGVKEKLIGRLMQIIEEREEEEHRTADDVLEAIVANWDSSIVFYVVPSGYGRASTVQMTAEIEEHIRASLPVVNAIRQNVRYKDIVDNLSSLYAGSIVLVGGPTASGKDSLIDAVTADLRGRAVVFPVDEYFHPRNEIPRIECDGESFADVDHPDSINWEWVEEDLRALLNGQEVDLPKYDIVTGEVRRHSGRKIKLEKGQIVMIDNAWALGENIASILRDIGSGRQVSKIYVDAPEEVRFARRLSRAYKKGENWRRYIKRWPLVIQRENEFITPTRSNADIIFYNYIPIEQTKGLRTCWVARDCMDEGTRVERHFRDRFPLTSSIRTRGSDLQVLKEGSLEEVIAHLRSIGNTREADNLRLAYDNALRNVRERTRRVTTTPQVRLVRDAPYTAAFDNVLDINIDMLESEVFTRLEIEEELYHVALNSRGVAPTITEEALQELLTDQVKVDRFHKLSVEEQAEYLRLVLTRPQDIDVYGFYKIYIRTYRDSGKFDRLISVLRDRYNIPAQVLDGLRVLRTGQGSISRLVYEYDAQAGVHSDGVRGEMLRLRQVAEGHDNYRYMLGLYDNNRDALDKAIYEECDRTCRTYEQVVLGCIGKDKVPQPYQLEMRKAHPDINSSDEELSVEYLLMGGGGYNTSGQARSALDVYNKMTEEQRNAIDSAIYVACSVAAFDDGGSSALIQNMLYMLFGEYFPAPGDPMAAVLFLMLDNWFKDYGVYSDQPGLAPTLRQGKTDLLLLNKNRFDLSKIDSVEAKMKDRLKEIFENTGIDKSRDWLFFTSAMLAVGRIIDENFLQYMKDQKSSAVQNLVAIAAAYDAGVFRRGQPLNNPNLNLAQEATGVEGGHVCLSSYEDATMVAVMEDGQEVTMQTHITDDEHSTLIDYLYFKKVRRKADGTFEKDAKGNRVYDEVKQGEGPKASEETIKLIRNTKKAIVIGAGSMFTSIAPVLMLQGVVEELAKAKERGIPVIFLVKPVWDLETSKFDDSGFKGMTPSEVSKVLEKTWQKVTGSKLVFGDVFSQVFMPVIPEATRKGFESVNKLKAKAKVFEVQTGVSLFSDEGKQAIDQISDTVPYIEAVNTIKGMIAEDRYLMPQGLDARNQKTLKMSKFLAIPAIHVTDTDRTYFRNAGVNVVDLDKEEDFMIWTGKIHYNPDSMFERTRATAIGKRAAAEEEGVTTTLDGHIMTGYSQAEAQAKLAGIQKEAITAEEFRRRYGITLDGIETVFLYDAVVEGPERYILDMHVRQDVKTQNGELKRGLYLARDLIILLQSIDTTYQSQLFNDYVFHAIRCEGSNHYAVIVEQKRKFGGNYTWNDVLGRYFGVSERDFDLQKGWLKYALRKFINLNNLNPTDFMRAIDHVMRMLKISDYPRVVQIFKTSIDPVALVNELVRISGRDMEGVLDVLRAIPFFSTIALDYRVRVAGRFNPSEYQGKQLDVVVGRDRYELTLDAQPETAGEPLSDYISAKRTASGSVPFVFRDDMESFVNDFLAGVEVSRSQRADLLKRVQQVLEFFSRIDVSKIKYVVTSGIGANEMYSHQLAQAVNAFFRGGVRWIVVNNPAHQNPNVIPVDADNSNTVVFEMSRSGSTQETVDFFNATKDRFKKRIVAANSGALRETSEDLGRRDPEAVIYNIIDIPGDIGGRQMNRKTLMVYVPLFMALYVGVKDISQAKGLLREYVQASLESNTGLSYSNGQNSEAVRMAEFLLRQRTGAKREKFALVYDPSLRATSKELVQLLNEGANKNIAGGTNRNILDAFSLDDQEIYDVIFSARPDEQMPIFLLNRNALNYAETMAYIEDLRNRRGIPCIVVSVDLDLSENPNLANNLRVLARTSNLLQDMVVYFTYLTNQDANSNPAVKFVREITAAIFEISRAKKASGAADIRITLQDVMAKIAEKRSADEVKAKKAIDDRHAGLQDYKAEFDEFRASIAALANALGVDVNRLTSAIIAATSKSVVQTDVGEAGGSKIAEIGEAFSRAILADILGIKSLSPKIDSLEKQIYLQRDRVVVSVAVEQDNPLTLDRGTLVERVADYLYAMYTNKGRAERLTHMPLICMEADQENPIIRGIVKNMVDNLADLGVSCPRLALPGAAHTGIEAIMSHPENIFVIGIVSTQANGGELGRKIVEGQITIDDATYVYGIGNVVRMALGGSPSVVFEITDASDLTMVRNTIQEALRLFRARIGVGEPGIHGSHIVQRVKRAEKGLKEKHVFSFELKKKGELGDLDTVPSETDEQETIRQYKDMLSTAMGMVEKEHKGLGIFAATDQIEIVRNLRSSMYKQGRAPLAVYVVENGVRKIKVDVKAFRHIGLLFEEVEHEFSESIARLVPGSNPGVSDVVATVKSVRRFLKDKQEAQDSFLGILSGDTSLDPDKEYQALLSRLRGIKGLAENELIASVVRYVLKTKLYEPLRKDLGLPDDLVASVTALEPRVDDALAVFSEIRKAREGGDLVEKVKERDELSIKVVKTFSGLRIKGLERLGDRLACIVSALVKVASKRDRLATELQGVKTNKRYCIIVDKGRQTGEMKEDIGRIQEYKTTTGERLFEVVSSLSEAQAKGFTGRGDIIHLVDPEDIRDEGNILYLPMPYLRSSLYMAAMVVVAGGDINSVNKLVMELLFDLYPGLAGLTPAEQALLFTQPWSRVILPSIQSVIAEMNNIRMTLDKIEEAA